MLRTLQQHLARQLVQVAKNTQHGNTISPAHQIIPTNPKLIWTQACKNALSSTPSTPSAASRIHLGPILQSRRTLRTMREVEDWYSRASELMYRRQKDADKVLYTLLGVNIGVFFLWQAQPEIAIRHFLLSPQNLQSGRVYTILTSAFSQRDFGHLASNMITLYFFGRSMGAVLGGRGLASLYLLGGLAGGVAHELWAAYKSWKYAGSQWHKHWRFSNAALGASAAVNSILVCSICLQPRATVLLYGFVPVPAALLGILYITYDLRGLLFGGEGHGGANVGYAAHIGGALCGALFYVGLRTRRLPHVLLQ